MHTAELRGDNLSAGGKEVEADGMATRSGERVYLNHVRYGLECVSAEMVITVCSNPAHTLHLPPSQVEHSVWKSSREQDAIVLLLRRLNVMFACQAFREI